MSNYISRPTTNFHWRRRRVLRSGSVVGYELVLQQEFICEAMDGSKVWTKYEDVPIVDDVVDGHE